ncbi:MAG: proton-conducting transporter membrane subunit [Spirochaetota bacterium]
MILILVAIALSALSGILPWLLPFPERARQVSTTALLSVGSLLGVAGTAFALGETTNAYVSLPWFLPSGAFLAGLDGLSAAFLVPVFAIGTLGSVYGLGYWKASAHPGTWRRLGLSWGALVAAMALVLVARDAVLFLVAWELMALASWLAATVESDKPEVRRAGWVYLVATHVGTLFLFAMFSYWRNATGSFTLEAVPGLGPAAAGTLFMLSLVGFGMKAGLVPLHFWLPGAHANAPSHVSALMSGVMIKLGIYGIFRMSSLLPRPEFWWGWTLLGIGALSAVAGISWSIAGRDLKRVLAYSSVENMGIIAMGGGLALLGRASGRADLTLLGMGGALLHVWNHGLFKSLLFLDAGAVIHASGTRSIDRMGGLARSMPVSAILFGLGCVAISALPPLNGFVGEWLMYLGFWRSVQGGVVALPAVGSGAAVLAIVGAIALAGFVRVFGMVFLGTGRAEPVEGTNRKDPSIVMLLPMIALAAACLVIGLFSAPFVGLAGLVAAAWASMPAEAGSLPDLAPTLPITIAAVVLVALALSIGLLLWRRVAAARTGALRRSSAAIPGAHAAAVPTWDCGYAAPTARMQYTASSFAEFPARSLSILLPFRREARLPKGALPGPSSFSREAPDPVLDLAVRPLFAFASRQLGRAKILQQGQTQMYLAYVLAVTVVLLVWGAGIP